MPRPLDDSVVVITGASSGIGRATALRFARAGADVVLAARREAPLAALAAECRQLGVRALAVPTDVRDEAAVHELARRTREELGRIDVWFSNAGVTVAARLEDGPPDVFRGVIETNLFGTVHSARAAVPVFLEQGSGVLIANASLFARMGAPYLTAYVSSKFAIRGFVESLRQELRRERDIHVCTLLPASIDTPIFQHGANYTGRALKALDPIVDVERVAAAVVRLAQRPRRETLIGGGGRQLALLRALTPPLGERVVARMVELDHFQRKPAPPSSGNVLAPIPGLTTSDGGWRAGRRRAFRALALSGGALAPLAVPGVRRRVRAGARRSR